MGVAAEERLRAQEPSVKWIDSIAPLWSATRFRARDLSAYAESFMIDETRRGVMAMSLVFLALLVGSALVHRELGLGRSYLYTSLALAALCVHVYFSSRAIREIRALNVLGMTLLIISGTAFVLLAHRTGLGAVLFTSVVLLFMLIPMVPWGLREASLVTLLLYAVLSSSTWTVAHRFDAETLWALQAFMLAAGVLSATLVARGTSVRREDIRSRFELESAHKEVKRLSLQDPLTQTWNRRFLETEYAGFAERVRKSHGVLHFAMIDIDKFKQLNDAFGHAYGDQVLQWVARAFRAHLGDAGHLIRAGGDEFVLLLDGDSPEELFEAAISSIRACAAEAGRGGAPEISLSVGLVELPPDSAATLDDAYLLADGALYRAKRAAAGGSDALRLARATPARDSTRGERGGRAP